MLTRRHRRHRARVMTLLAACAFLTGSVWGLSRQATPRAPAPRVAEPVRAPSPIATSIDAAIPARPIKPPFEGELPTVRDLRHPVAGSGQLR